MSVKVSIIIPAFNIEKYIRKCLESVVAQTYGNIEIIVINDGSTDNTLKFIEEFNNNDKIFIYTKTNGGLSSARNYGIEKATGDYYIFIDGDDYIAPNMVELLIKQVAKMPKLKLVVCDYYVDTNGNIDNNKHNIPIGICNESQYWSYKYTNRDIYYTVAWNKLYHKSLFEKVKYDEGKIHEDDFIIHKILEQCEDESIYLLNDRLYYYVFREGSIMHKPYTAANLDAIEYAILRAEYFLSRDYKTYCIHCMNSIVEGFLIAKSKQTNDFRISNRIKQLRSQYKQLCKKIKFGQFGFITFYWKSSCYSFFISKIIFRIKKLLKPRK